MQSLTPCEVLPHGSSSGSLALRYRSWSSPVPASPPWLAPGPRLALPVLPERHTGGCFPSYDSQPPLLVPDPLIRRNPTPSRLPVWLALPPYDALLRHLSAPRSFGLHPRHVLSALRGSSSRRRFPHVDGYFTLSGRVYSPALSAPGCSRTLRFPHSLLQRSLPLPLTPGGVALHPQTPTLACRTAMAFHTSPPVGSVLQAHRRPLRTPPSLFPASSILYLMCPTRP